MNKPLQQRVGAVSHGNPHPGPLLLSLSKAAQRLGVSKLQIKRLAAEGKIKPVECGDQTKYNTASIDAYANGEVPHVVLNQRGVRRVFAEARAKAKARRAA